jgi:hypothetical protein
MQPVAYPCVRTGGLVRNVRCDISHNKRTGTPIRTPALLSASSLVLIALRALNAQLSVLIRVGRPLTTPVLRVEPCTSKPIVAFRGIPGRRRRCEHSGRHNRRGQKDHDPSPHDFTSFPCLLPRTYRVFGIGARVKWHMYGESVESEGELPLFTNCREVVFSETHLQVIDRLCIGASKMAHLPP